MKFSLICIHLDIIWFEDVQQCLGSAFLLKVIEDKYPFVLFHFFKGSGHYSFERLEDY